MDRYIFIAFVICIVTFVLGVYVGSSTVNTEYDLLCKQTKELKQKNNVILTCVENKR